MRLAKATLLFTLAPAAAWAQVNVGEQKPEATLPFNMTTVTTFKLPWRLAFLPDGRMPVSYTHLDVYKRQIWNCRSPATRATSPTVTCT